MHYWWSKAHWNVANCHCIVNITTYYDVFINYNKTAILNGNEVEKVPQAMFNNFSFYKLYNIK